MRVVLDASALLAVMRREKGGEVTAPRLPDAMLTTVNLVEVVSRLVDLGDDPGRALADIRNYRVAIVPFDSGLAADAIRLRPLTRHAGLSLGDRACLALAIRERATVLTADRAWAALELGCEIELIR